MAVYGPVPGLKWRTSELWVLNRWVFNFCVRSTPLRGGAARKQVVNTTVGPILIM